MRYESVKKFNTSLYPKTYRLWGYDIPDNRQTEANNLSLPKILIKSAAFQPYVVLSQTAAFLNCW